MKDIFDKISSYNLFNYLLPGILFVAVTKYFIGYNFILENDLIGAFVYYFIGMIISRFGSLILEPVLKKVKFVKFTDYKHFVSASKKDNTIVLLSEINNTYRTITAMLLLLLSLKGYNLIEARYHFTVGITFCIVILLVLLMFLYSYRKQTNYINKRVNMA